MAANRRPIRLFLSGSLATCPVSGGHLKALERGAPLAGEIRIRDRNYARALVLRRFRAQGGGTANFIVRLGWTALQLTNPASKPFDLISYLQCLPPGWSPH